MRHKWVTRGAGARSRAGAVAPSFADKRVTMSARSIPREVSQIAYKATRGIEAGLVLQRLVSFVLLDAPGMGATDMICHPFSGGPICGRLKVSAPYESSHESHRAVSEAQHQHTYGAVSPKPR